MKKKFLNLKPLFNSVQSKFAFSFLIVIAALLILLNIYPSVFARNTIFSSKNTAMKNQAALMCSALSSPENLTPDVSNEIMSLFELSSFARVMVYNESGQIVFDNAILDNSLGKFAFLPEVFTALQGENVCRSVYDGESFKTFESMAISKNGSIVGGVYLYEYDEESASLISNLQSMLTSLSFFIGLVSLLVIVFFSQRLTQRITDLASATRIVSAGDYEHQINISGHDELSLLGHEFNSLTQRLKETEELRRRFVSDASHELKTPLASIRLLSDSIVNADDMDEEIMREFVSDIGNEAQRLQLTTEKLLSLTKLDSNIKHIKEPIALAEILENALRPLKPLADNSEIYIYKEILAKPMIYGNEDLIHRIIFNLVENAIKYTLPKGFVKVCLRTSAKEVFLIVEDNGIGIPKEDMPHIFSRFYRVDKARSREAGGSGLGLSIVHDAVSLHNGTICVEANEPRGTRFKVSFPVYREGVSL